jgi:hypothetical protein
MYCTLRTKLHVRCSVYEMLTCRVLTTWEDDDPFMGIRTRKVSWRSFLIHGGGGARLKRGTYSWGRHGFAHFTRP